MASVNMGSARAVAGHRRRRREHRAACSEGLLAYRLHALVVPKRCVRINAQRRIRATGRKPATCVVRRFGQTNRTHVVIAGTSTDTICLRSRIEHGCVAHGKCGTRTGHEWQRWISGDKTCRIDGRHPNSRLVDLEKIRDERVEVDVRVGKVVEGKLLPIPLECQSFFFFGII